MCHKSIGHLNIRSMRQFITTKDINGLPNLNIEEGRIYGDFQIGKQSMMSHKKLQHLTTSKVMDLLHMDLMGPMQVESIGGKSYNFMCIDDYSRLTYIYFLRENQIHFPHLKDYVNNFGVKREGRCERLLKL